MAEERGILRKVGPTLAVALIVGLATLTSAAEPQNDAGSGADAGNLRATATTLPGFGSYSGYLSANDADWFTATRETSSPACAYLTANGEGAMRVHLSAEKGASSWNATSTTVAGGAVRMGVAAPAMDRVALMLADASTSTASGTPFAPGWYGFALSTVGVPSLSSGDALSGLDAGATLATALNVSTACFGGNLMALTSGDSSDYYRVTLPDGQYIQYSLGTTSSDSSLGLKLLDAAGNVVGATIGNGQQASSGPLPGGTYYLALSGGSLTDAGYVVGMVVGPNPPANGCRPNC